MAPRSLSIVFGTPTTGTPCSPSLVATPRVSSPPIAISASTPRPARLSLIRSMPLRPPPLPAFFSGLVRDDPRIVPPRGRMPRTAWMSRGIVSPSSGPRHPSRNPTNSRPYSCTPLRTTARITAFSPGQSPPPVRTPTRMAITLVGGGRRGCMRPELSEKLGRQAMSQARQRHPNRRFPCRFPCRPRQARPWRDGRRRRRTPGRRASAIACMISSVIVRSSLASACWPW